MKNTLLTLACLALLQGAASALTLNNNTKDTKTAVVKFKNGETFEAVIDGHQKSDVKRDTKAISVKWYWKNGGKPIATCPLKAHTDGLAVTTASLISTKSRFACIID